MNKNNADKIWTTWDNRSIPITDMETKHLKSAIQTIERIIAQKYKLRKPDPAINQLATQDYPQYPNLVAELMQRQNRSLKSTFAEQLAALKAQRKS